MCFIITYLSANTLAKLLPTIRLITGIIASITIGGIGILIDNNKDGSNIIIENKKQMLNNKIRSGIEKIKVNDLKVRIESNKK